IKNTHMDIRNIGNIIFRLYDTGSLYEITKDPIFAVYNHIPKFIWCILLYPGFIGNRPGNRRYVYSLNTHLYDIRSRDVRFPSYLYPVLLLVKKWCLPYWI